MIEDSLNGRERATFENLLLNPVNPRVLSHHLTPASGTSAVRELLGRKRL